MQRFKLGMAIKILILITILMPISTKVTDIDSLVKNINSFSYAKNEWQTWQTCNFSRVLVQTFY